MTKNQIAAALMSFAVVFLLLIVLNWLTFLFPSGPLGKVFHAVSAFDQMEDFQRGIVDVRPLVLVRERHGAGAVYHDARG